GCWAGPVPEPVQGLAEILAKPSDGNGRAAVPGLWDDVVPPSAAEMEDMGRLGLTDEVFREQAGIASGVRLFAEGPGLLAKMWREPSITVNSIQAGGKKIAGNVIMDSAWARVGLRLVPDMDHAKAMRLLTGFIEANCPWGLKVEVVPEQGANPWMTKPDHPVFSVAKK